MAYIITEPCIGTKDTACVDVCPVDCIHPRKDEPEFATTEMLYIHPDECIDCGACVPACPVEAIFALDETPDKWKNFIETNAQYYPEVAPAAGRPARLWNVLSVQPLGISGTHVPRADCSIGKSLQSGDFCLRSRP